MLPQVEVGQVDAHHTDVMIYGGKISVRPTHEEPRPPRPNKRPSQPLNLTDDTALCEIGTGPPPKVPRAAAPQLEGPQPAPDPAPQGGLPRQELPTEAPWVRVYPPEPAVDDESDLEDLYDYSSGSGEEYEPDSEDLDTTDREDISDETALCEIGTGPPPKVPRAAAPQLEGPQPAPDPAPQGGLPRQELPTEAPWVRVYPPEPAVDIRNFQPRPQRSSPIPHLLNPPPPVFPANDGQVAGPSRGIAYEAYRAKVLNKKSAPVTPPSERPAPLRENLRPNRHELYKAISSMVQDEGDLEDLYD
ncbi:uncharacterized protein LOC128984548 [Macrosteles quadrilineatus]|uniref:uncharacterized protein LOC128984548 n=1 Tax=Macrosteles quadrilineatus TaxID=74068 RepID=UPI0023E2B149|nr:uncharacterized protein LOC128984548 [Macrosteles quadrilineatus]